MATKEFVDTRALIEEEYATWAQIVQDKHGMPWPIPEDRVNEVTPQRLVLEIKKLKELARTPHT